jgi:hypothetical protein
LRLSLKRLASLDRKNRAARRAATSLDRCNDRSGPQTGPSFVEVAIMPKRWGIAEAHVRY